MDSITGRFHRTCYATLNITLTNNLETNGALKLFRVHSELGLPVNSVVFAVMVSCKLSSRRFRNFIICHKLCVLLFKLLFGTVLDSALNRSRLSKLRLKNGVCGCKIVWSCLVVHPVRNSAWSLYVLPVYRTCK